MEEDTSFTETCYGVVKHDKNNVMLTAVALTKGWLSSWKTMYYLGRSASQEEAAVKYSKRIYLTI